MSESSREVEGKTGRHWFVTTHWSAVLAARKDSKTAEAALGALCQTYWYPLYAYIRRLGHSPSDAEDLVQSFFSRCLENNYLSAADQNKGRFRTFLLVALKRFLANEWDKIRTRKRGEGRKPLALDALSAEERYAIEPANLQSPDKLYERRWALTLLERVLARLEKEQQNAGNALAFAEYKPLLTGTGEAYAQIAKRLHVTEGSVKVTIHRLRRRYREILEEEIAHTVSSAAEIQEERRYLLSVLSA